MPYANTLIRLLLATLHTVEHSPYAFSESGAFQKLRDGIEAMVAELERVAKKEPRRQPSLSMGFDLYQPRRR